MLCLIAVKGWSGGPVHWLVIDKQEMASDMAGLAKRFQHMKRYEVNVTHASFTDYKTDIAHQSFKGYFKRNNEEFHNFLLGVQTIQTAKCKVVIDSERKVIAVADPISSLDSIMPVSDYTTTYKLCSSIKRSVIANRIYYRMEFKENYSVSAIELTVKDSLPEKIVMYYSKAVKQGGSSTKPRLEISFSNWNTKFSGDKEFFDIQKYLDNKGNQYFLKTPYAAKFKLLDERVLTRNAKK